MINTWPCPNFDLAEVTVLANKKIKVNKVWVAGDIGSQIINLGASENLTQGAIVDGMSEMLQEISLKNGRVVLSNYHQHPMLKMSQTPLRTRSEIILCHLKVMTC